MKRFVLFVLSVVVSGFTFLSAQVRQEILLEKNWKFTREDNPQFISPDFDDAAWQSVTIPHDWAIYGPFSAQNDKQDVAITQDGQKDAMEHAGRTGGLPFVGVGWYRSDFEIPSLGNGRKAVLLFDGAMSNAEVYVNGKKAGYWPYGYNSFHFDITDLVREGKNTLAVRLENYPESSRWYPGAGIYRNVHLVLTEDAHIPVWGTQVQTPVVTPEFAKVNIKTNIDRPEGSQPGTYRLVTEIRDGKNTPVATHTDTLGRFDRNRIEQELIVAEPACWTPEQPHLYTAVSRLYEGNALKDEYTTPFGIRTIEIVPGKGFLLNVEVMVLWCFW